jgi:hypothetical protein
MPDIRPIDWGRTGADRAIRAYRNARRTQTWQYLSNDPLRAMQRFLPATLLAWLAMGLFIFISYDARLPLQRFANSIMVGLTFGVMVGMLVLIAGEYPTRLGRLWPRRKRLIIWGILSAIWGALTWGVYHYFLLYRTDVSWVMLLVGGIGLALGFFLTPILNLSKWTAVGLTVFCIYLPIYVTYQRFLDPTWLRDLPLNFGPIMFFRQPIEVFTLAFPFALLIALGGHWGQVHGGN